MQNLQPILIEQATGISKQLLDVVNAETGTLSNMIRTMARSPHVLEGYVQFKRALAAGKLNPRLREQIALAVAQTNECEYSLAEHTAAAERIGLTDDEIISSLGGHASDKKAAAALQFVRYLARTGEAEAADLKIAGFNEEEIAEIVGAVALNTFENHFNNVANTEVDISITGRRVQAA